ncbi:MAG: hypothetical protein ACRDT0_01015 [Pseudonocardiaceae bacterium]
MTAAASDAIDGLTMLLTRELPGTRVLAPGRPGHTIQPVDVRDVADF